MPFSLCSLPAKTCCCCCCCSSFSCFCHLLCALISEKIFLKQFVCKCQSCKQFCIPRDDLQNKSSALTSDLWLLLPLLLPSHAPSLLLVSVNWPGWVGACVICQLSLNWHRNPVASRNCTRNGNCDWFRLMTPTSAATETTTTTTTATRATATTTATATASPTA